MTHKLSREKDIAEQYVRFVANEAVPEAMNLDEFKRATSSKHYRKQSNMCALVSGINPSTWKMLM